jgi:hypothetical protein
MERTYIIEGMGGIGKLIVKGFLACCYDSAGTQCRESCLFIWQNWPPRYRRRRLQRYGQIQRIYQRTQKDVSSCFRFQQHARRKGIICKFCLRSWCSAGCRSILTKCLERLEAKPYWCWAPSVGGGRIQHTQKISIRSIASNIPFHQPFHGRR